MIRDVPREVIKEVVRNVDRVVEKKSPPEYVERIVHVASPPEIHYIDNFIEVPVYNTVYEVPPPPPPRYVSRPIIREDFLEPVRMEEYRMEYLPEYRSERYVEDDWDYPR